MFAASWSAGMPRGLVIVWVVLAACGRPSTEPYHVGIALPADTSAFDPDLRGRLLRAADSLGFRATAAPLDTLLRRRVDAVIVAPAFGGAPDMIARTRRAGIPVLTIGGDDRQGGRLLGEHIARLLEGGGNVVILDQPANALVRDRVAGFRDALAGYPNIRVVAMPTVEPGERLEAQRKLQPVLATNRRIDVVFGTDDECALGALAAIEAAARRDVLVVGFAGAAETRAAIARGSALTTGVTVDGATLTRRAIEAVMGLRDGADPAAVTAPVTLLERASLAAAAAQP
jgi:ribose transport system substrate-binding protein